MKNIIGAFLMVVFVVAGAFAADLLKKQKSADGAHAEASHGKSKKDDHGKDDGHGKKDDHAGKDDHGDDYGEPSDSTFYLKFSRQFIVPVIEQSKVDALVIMTLSVEVDPSKSEMAYSMQPRVRDALTRSLLTLSSEGAFSGHMTDPENLEHIQKMLNKSAKNLLGKALKGVLILDMARQDQ